MYTDIEQDMKNWAEEGFDCIAYTDFCDDEPFMLAYRLDLLQFDSVVDAIYNMPEIFSNGEERIEWNDGQVEICGWRCPYFGREIKCLELCIKMSDNESNGEPVIYASSICDGDKEGRFSYADMYDTMRNALEEYDLVKKAYQ